MNCAYLELRKYIVQYTASKKSLHTVYGQFSTSYNDKIANLCHRCKKLIYVANFQL